MAERHLKVGETVRFGAVTHDPSGGNLRTADETPRWFVYEEGSDTPLLSDDFILRSSLPGTYRGHFDASGSIGFESNKYYEVHASGKVRGIVGRDIVSAFILDDVFDANIVQVTGLAITLEHFQDNLYYADIKFLKDGTNTQDEYGISWFKNGLPISSGSITNPAFSVFNVQNGNALINNQKLNYSSTLLSSLFHTESSNLTTSGVPYLVIASGLVDSQTRSWREVVGVDIL